MIGTKTILDIQMNCLINAGKPVTLHIEAIHHNLKIRDIKDIFCLKSVDFPLYQL